MKTENCSANRADAKRLKVLAVGNSFSVDAMQHLYLVAKDAGIEEILLGNLYIGGCSLDTHNANMVDDLGKYTFYVSSEEAGGMVVEGENRTAKYGITYADWDYITVQQASNQSGLPEKYSKLNDVIEYITANETSNAKLLWHETWAYQSDSAHPGFANYGNSQENMYRAIVNTITKVISPNDALCGIIPSGTAIQNLRTTALGDNLTRDGFHLSLGIGRYTAALTWLAAITGVDVSSVSAVPEAYPEVLEWLDDIKCAVKCAIERPLDITEISPAK